MKPLIILINNHVKIFYMKSRTKTLSSAILEALRTYPKAKSVELVSCRKINLE